MGRHKFSRITPWQERVVRGDSGCLLWQGATDRDGYGRWGRGLAHRVVFELERGPIAAGMVLDHLCRTRLCVNPLHLEPVSIGENLRRSPLTFQGQNAAKTHCIRGHAFDDENTRVISTRWGTQARQCRSCERERATERKALQP